MEIATERLLLRELVENDWQSLFEIERIPAVVRHLTHGPLDEEDARDYVQTALAESREVPRLVHELAITERGGDGTMRGRCGLRRHEDEPRTAYMWYVLAPAYVGRGYATEAARALMRHGFETVHLHRLYAELDPRNTRSARVLERLGMRREAHHLRDVWLHDEWCDTMVYALLADEWAARATAP